MKTSIHIYRKFFIILLSFCLLAAIFYSSPFLGKASGEKKTSKASWTILMYFCGDDLESESQNATINMGEFYKSRFKANDKVNIIVQTGGTRLWHASKIGMDVNPDKLQRWSFGKDGFTLVDEVPLANMSNKRTVQEYIEWGTKSYPAEKYMLCMWGHGGGAFAGLMSDELYNDNELMSVKDLSTALKNAGVKFEALFLDCCLMAGIEEASLFKDYVHYYIASEETAPVFGASYKEWVPYVYDHPDCDGKDIGKTLCEGTKKKYNPVSEAKIEQVESDTDLITFSCLDLSKTQKLEKAYDAMFERLNEIMEDDPAAYTQISDYTSRAEYMGMDDKWTIDVSDFARKARQSPAMDDKLCDDVIKAVDEMVACNEVGKGKTHSRGISFFYALNEPYIYLTTYAPNCSSAPFLAYLDGVNGIWSAPDWVYQQTKVPDIKDSDYKVIAKTKITDKEELTLDVENGKKCLMTIDGVLAMKTSEKDNEWIYLGDSFKVKGDFDKGQFTACFDGKWPMIGDKLLSVADSEETDRYVLFNIPVTIDDETEPDYLRAAMLFDERLTEDRIRLGDYSGQFKTYGIWEKYDDYSLPPSRQSAGLDSYEGSILHINYQSYDPLEREVTGTYPVSSIKIDGQKDLITYGDLPSGTYCYAFKMTDALGHESYSDTYIFTYDAKSRTVDWQPKSVEQNYYEGLQEEGDEIYDIIVNQD